MDVHLLSCSRAAFGAILLACTMIGAILAHVFILHSNPGSPAVLLVLVGAIVWLRRGQIVAQFTARPKAIGVAECANNDDVQLQPFAARVDCARGEARRPSRRNLVDETTRPFLQDQCCGVSDSFCILISRIDILVIDDWALAPLSEPERRDFWEICEDRYQVRSRVLTSQLPVSRWHEQQIGDPTLADGILGRLVHNAHRIEMRGDSMRKPRGAPKS